ncbi:MAG: LysM peptidoglycan-binding domain-containing protein [Haliea sp.]|nr:MAG: LysM peptidoglycan-binding domain-containing protein [Haliea sp.]
MSPPISKDWWLAAALTGAALPAALAQPAPQPVAASAPGAGPSSYTVRQGDTLSRIGSETGLDWRDLALWNGISNPDVIPVGLLLRLTPPEGMATSARARASVVSPSARAGTRKPPIYVTETRGQRITTGPGETTHVLFSDQSAITVGPNSEVVITEYQYTPPPPSVTPAAALQAGSGQLLLQMPKGILRVVGGLLSKRSATLVRTPTATIGIRGGISIVEHNDQGATTGTFLFGDEMRATQESTGRTETVLRPGFGVVVTGTEFRGPERTTREELARQLAQVQAEDPPPSGQTGDAPDPNATRQVNNVAPDRVTGPGREGAPTLADILGSQAPGNQS